MTEEYLVEVEILRWLLNKAAEGFHKDTTGREYAAVYVKAGSEEDPNVLTLCVRYTPHPAVLILIGRQSPVKATLKALLYGELSEAMQIGREQKVTTYLCVEPTWDSEFVHMTGQELLAIHRAVNDSNLPKFIKEQFNGAHWN